MSHITRSRLTQSPAWQALQQHYNLMSQQSLRGLFEADPQRFKHFSLKFNDILLDYSKNQISEETMQLLHELADSQDLRQWIDRMFNGDPINHTEQRAVLHTALRNRTNKPVLVAGHDVMPEAHRHPLRPI